MRERLHLDLGLDRTSCLLSAFKPINDCRSATRLIPDLALKRIGAKFWCFEQRLNALNGKTGIIKSDRRSKIQRAVKLGGRGLPIVQSFGQSSDQDEQSVAFTWQEAIVLNAAPSVLTWNANFFNSLNQFA
ncbi:hypothetical protein O1K_18333 [Xanthomonas fragariae LMG 25863]|nr:hypothetical protein O1K_18333 [Xanthomonas fragariae LMG 25863]